jgi:hypothetical protein
MNQKPPLEILHNLGHNGPDTLAALPPILLDPISTDLVLACHANPGEDLLPNASGGSTVGRSLTRNKLPFPAVSLPRPPTQPNRPLKRPRAPVQGPSAVGASLESLVPRFHCRATLTSDPAQSQYRLQSPDAALTPSRPPTTEHCRCEPVCDIISP